MLLDKIKALDQALDQWVKKNILLVILFVLTVCLLGVGYFWWRIQNALDVSQMHKTTSYKISDALILHRTSGSMVSIYDRDDFGLVQGNIIGICFYKDTVIVESIPFDSSSEKSRTITAFDINTGKKVNVFNEGLRFKDIHSLL